MEYDRDKDERVVGVVDEVNDAASIRGLDPKDEAKLTRKFDMFLIPMLGLLYLLCFLDRANIGNANVAEPSISSSLGLRPHEFGAAVSVVYATYVVFEPIWANLLKIVTPRVLLSGSTVTWGALTLSTAWASNYGHLIAIRVLLGAFEAGLFPCISVYVFMTYRREEIAQRMSYIFLNAGLAGAFGGLIAYGLTHIRNGSLHGWQWLFITEGAMTLAAAPLAFFYIPKDMTTAWFLTAEEREHVKIRQELNKYHYNPDEPFTWREVRKGILDWKTYTTGTIQFCADITLYGLSTFMPAIIRGMGHSSVNAQLLTVPVYCVAIISFLIMGRLSDKYKLRSPFIVLCFVFILIGYVVLATVDNPNRRYAGVFLAALGLYAIPGLNVSWVSGNTAGHYKRTTAFGINQLIGNSAGAAIGSIYSSTLAPRYYRSLYISIALSAFGLIMALGTAWNFNKLNKQREKLIAEGALDQPELGDLNPHFKYYL